jgi:energy-coupling factor transporter transmembrane protein EcfT
MVAIEIIISLLIFALLLISAIYGLKFFFACVSAIFSKKSASQVRGRPIAHAVWSIVGLFSLMLILTAFGFEPPGLYRLVLLFERPHQRHVIFERIQSSGGWNVLQKESEDLLDKHRGEYFLWDKWHTNMPPLTAALAALKPETVWVDERSNLPPILRIEVFGMWHTGSEPTPYYGIWITRNPLAATLNPQSLIQGQFGLIGANQVHCITNQIYEIY